jgi:hypothetical protein
MLGTGTKPFEIIRASDDAWRDEQLPAYETYVYGGRVATPELLASFAERPTIYWGRPLTKSEQREVRNKTSEGDQYEAAFVRGLVKVENLEREDGSRYDWIRPDDRSGKPKIITDAELMEHFDEAIVEEIGMVIRNRSFLGRTKGAFFPLPAISLAAVLARKPRPAAQTSGSSNSDATKPPAEAPPGTTPPSSPAGASSTGATATG